MHHNRIAGLAYVLYGSKADILNGNSHVRFTPESRHKPTLAGMSALCHQRTFGGIDRGSDFHGYRFSPDGLAIGLPFPRNLN